LAIKESIKGLANLIGPNIGIVLNLPWLMIDLVPELGKHVWDELGAELESVVEEGALQTDE
jgi:hypothetical protein